MGGSSVGTVINRPISLFFIWLCGNVCAFSLVSYDPFVFQQCYTDSESSDICSSSICCAGLGFSCELLSCAACYPWIRINTKILFLLVDWGVLSSHCFSFMLFNFSYTCLVLLSLAAAAFFAGDDFCTACLSLLCILWPELNDPLIFV